MGKTIQEYIEERDLGITSEQVLSALQPVFEEIRKDALKEFEKIDFSCYQKVDNRDCFLLSLKLRMVNELESGLSSQISKGRSADQAIKEHQRK